MEFIDEIERFSPSDPREETDKTALLHFARVHKDTVLLRENTIAHITSSGFLMNRKLDKVLLVHHNSRNVWAWTGGHADGEENLLQVAIREAKEETGLLTVHPLFPQIASLDILPVQPHYRKGKYVNVHLHLSVSYLLIGDEAEEIRPNPSENTQVAWFDVSYFTGKHFDVHDVYLYQKLIRKAQNFREHAKE